MKSLKSFITESVKSDLRKYQNNAIKFFQKIEKHDYPNAKPGGDTYFMFDFLFDQIKEIDETWFYTDETGEEINEKNFFKTILMNLYDTDSPWKDDLCDALTDRYEDNDEEYDYDAVQEDVNFFFDDLYKQLDAYIKKMR